MSKARNAIPAQRLQQLQYPQQLQPVKFLAAVSLVGIDRSKLFCQQEDERKIKNPRRNTPTWLSIRTSPLSARIRNRLGIHMYLLASPEKKKVSPAKYTDMITRSQPSRLVSARIRKPTRHPHASAKEPRYPHVSAAASLSRTPAPHLIKRGNLSRFPFRRDASAGHDTAAEAADSAANCHRRLVSRDYERNKSMCSQQVRTL